MACETINHQPFPPKNARAAIEKQVWKKQETIRRLLRWAVFAMQFPMTSNESSLELTIESVAYRGKGIARHDGLVVFVPETLPGERVVAEIVARRKRHAEARALRVTKASPDRAVPDCPLFGSCPGCVYQHARYGEEVRIKQDQLANFLRRTAAWQEDATVGEPVPSPLETGYRNKIVLHSAVHVGAAPVLGYVGEDNRTVVDVSHCPLARPEIGQRLAELRSQPSFLNSLPDGEDITLRHTVADGTLVWVGESSPGKERLEEESPWGPLRVPRLGFFQVNPALIPAVTEAIQAELAALGSDTVLDLYCGCGLLSLAATHAGAKRVIGVDSDAKAIRFAQANVRKLGTAAESVFIAGRCRDLLPNALRDIAPARTAIVADPPRRGLEPAVLDMIGRSAVPALLYVSCAADTLARDLNRLAGFGFRLRAARLFDMFPRTPYFESLAVLAR